MTPKVSVIIPVYNCELYIAEAIESVFNQTYTDYEIIVINDGSTDNTCQVLQPYMTKIRYFYQENKGLSATRNQGIKMAKGELIALLDADDLFLCYKLQEQVAIFDSQPSIGLVQSGWRVVNEKGEKIQDVEPWHKSPELDLVSWLKWKATNPSGMMFRKEWLERVNGFNENLRRLEDFDIVIRLALAGCQATWFPKVAVCYRQHSGNMTRNLLAQTEVEEKILDELFSNPNLPPEIQDLERELRYGSLIWNCWCLYKSGYFAEMADYLDKSLKFSPVSVLKTICEWLYYFDYYGSLENYSFNSVSLNQIPEWQLLINKIMPNGLPLVSVVIPTFNNADYILKAITSIFSQTYTFWEIIIIDDGSTDNTYQVLESYLNQIHFSQNFPTGNRPPEPDKNFQETGSNRDLALEFLENYPTGKRQPQADKNFQEIGSNQDSSFNFSQNSPTGNRQPQADGNFQEIGSNQDLTLDFLENSPTGKRQPEADKNFQETGSNQDSSFNFSQNSPTGNRQSQADKNFQEIGSNRDLTLNFSQNSPTGNKQPQADKNFHEIGSNQDLALDFSQNSPTGNKQPQADKNFHEIGSNQDLALDFLENSPTGNRPPQANKNFHEIGSNQDSTLDFSQNYPTGNRPPQADKNFQEIGSNQDLALDFLENSPTGNIPPQADKNFQEIGSNQDLALDFLENSPTGNIPPQADKNFQEIGSNQDSTLDFSQNYPTGNRPPQADKNFQETGSKQDSTLDFSQNYPTGNRPPQADKNFQEIGSNQDSTLDFSQNSPTGNRPPQADKNFQEIGSNQDLALDFSQNYPIGNRQPEADKNYREKPSNQNLTLTFAGGLIKYVYQENQGPSIARNSGIEIAQGEYIAFLDADDFFLPEKLAEQVGCFAEDSTLTMVQTGWRFVDEKGNTIKDVKPWKNSTELDLENWLIWQATLPSAMMFKSEWLKLNGGFDKRYFGIEDLEIVLRLALTGGKATWLKKVCVCYRQRNSSVSGLDNRQKITQELEKLLDDFFQKPNLPTAIRQIENQIKYRSLLWNCWRLYKAGNFSEMATYLQKSLSYTSDSPTAAICTWIELFTKLDSQEGNQFNAYSFSQLPEWKKLISNIFNPVVPRVTVIIATYNNAHYILEAIASIFNQTYTSYEVIVIDDGSNDHTRQVLEPYLDKIRYVYQENKGVSHARNLGLEMARGEFISFLDADDFFLPDKLAKQVAIFDSRPSLGIVHSGWRLVNQKGDKISDIELWHGSPELDLETWVVWKPVTISMMFRKSWIKSAGGFDTRWHHGEDIDLVLRLSINGCEAVWLPKVTYCYRQHHRNATRKSSQQAVSMMAVLDNFFTRPNLSISIRQLEGKSRYYTLSWLAWQAHRNGDLIEMGKYLRQAGKYTPLSMTETIEYWMDSFNSLYQQYGYNFDAYTLTNSDVWQQLMLDMVIPFH